MKVVIVNPGAHATPLLINQLSGGSNAFFERHNVAGGSLWRDALSKGGQVAQDYMTRYARDPKEFGQKMTQLVHTPSEHCPDRVLINVSLLMRLVRWTPQWVLDASFKLQMGALGPKRALRRLCCGY